MTPHLAILYRRSGLTFLATLTLLVGLPSMAGAATVVVSTSKPALTLDAVTVTIVVSAVLPILTGLITRITLPSWAKGLITLLLNAITALIVANRASDGSATFSKDTLILAAVGFVVSVATYAGILKPAGVSSSSSPPEAGYRPPMLAPGFGIGGAG
jgi:hypothetical protein